MGKEDGWRDGGIVSTYSREGWAHGGIVSLKIEDGWRDSE